jgi:hypothetical protein
MIICHVALQSAHVTGVPSDQFAFGLNVNCVVSGLFLSSFGGPVNSRVTQFALLSRIWPPRKMLLTTSDVAYSELSTQLTRRLGGSWS